MIEPHISKADLHTVLKSVDDCELTEVAVIHGMQIDFTIWVTDTGVYWGGVIPPIWVNTDQYQMELRTWDYAVHSVDVAEAFEAALTWARDAAVQDLKDALG